MLPSIISSLTESKLEWPTQLMTLVYSDYHSSMVASVASTIEPKVNHKSKPLTMENNLYNSKPMTIILHIPVYHVIRCNLISTVSYMHVFHKLIIFIILSLITHFHKNKVHNNEKCISCEL
jgi:hypothetical protein